MFGSRNWCIKSRKVHNYVSQIPSYATGTEDKSLFMFIAAISWQVKGVAQRTQVITSTTRGNK